MCQAKKTKEYNKILQIIKTKDNKKSEMVLQKEFLTSMLTYGKEYLNEHN